MIIRCNFHKSTEEILSDQRYINPYSNTGEYFSLSIESVVDNERMMMIIDRCWETGSDLINPKFSWPQNILDDMGS